jgi:hypothetical protein
MKVLGVAATVGMMEAEALALGGRVWSDVDENGRGTPTCTYPGVVPTAAMVEVNGLTPAAISENCVVNRCCG